MNTKTNNRFKFAFKIAGIHFLASIAVALAAAALVWRGWYYWPYHEILKISGLYQLIIIVDVVCGPLLTFILASPQKSRRETKVDLSLVVIVQLSALIYGLYSLYVVRPVAVVFEVDRFVVLSANEINGERQLPLMGIKEYSLKEPEDSEEKLAMLDFSLQGQAAASNPEWWENPSDSIFQTISQKAKPLTELYKAKPQHQAELTLLAEKHNQQLEQLLYLPLVSSNNFNWIRVLNPQGKTIDHANIDGFL